MVGLIHPASALSWTFASTPSFTAEQWPRVFFGPPFRARTGAGDHGIWHPSLCLIPVTGDVGRGGSRGGGRLWKQVRVKAGSRRVRPCDDLANRLNQSPPGPNSLPCIPPRPLLRPWRNRFPVKGQRCTNKECPARRNQARECTVMTDCMLVCFLSL